MVLVRLLFLIFLISGCAKVSYLWDQGIGQVSLMTSARSNKEVLNDEEVSLETKSKIRLIEKYKAYFYQYWGEKASGIYSETTILENDAVTYLVIVSPLFEVKPIKHCFPFMGCFPYLGFFSEDKAKSFAKDLREEENETYIRPVYAYSTLGYLEDKILSSFFSYDDYQLAELIFHELFHTIFFIKNEVELNEALATHFSRLMAFEYFNYNDFQIESKKAHRGKYVALNRSLASEISLYNKILKEKKLSERKTVESFRANHLEKEMFPRLKKKCDELKVSNCYPVKRKWNNASLAAFMTYENKGKNIERLQSKYQLNLKDFYKYLQSSYEQYQEKDIKEKYSVWLFKNVEDID